MSSNDPKRRFAIEVANRLQQAGFQALWAGGCVRDFLLGRDPSDYDIATDARPEQVRDLFGHRRTLAVGASFGVIIVRGSRQAGNVEVATFRTEGPYLDGRRPEHVEFTSPEEDAKRRDFTINGMFYDPTAQQVLDFVGGEKDLSAGIVRAIGDPHARMSEDKLRMLRAIRFAAHLDFELDPATASAIREMADDIHIVSAERISQELRRMLVDRHRRRAMSLAHEVGLLLLIFPELNHVLDAPADGDSATPWQQTLQMLEHLQHPGFGLAAAVLLHGSVPEQEENSESPSEWVRRIGRRLRWSNHEIDHVEWLLAHRNDLNDGPNLPLAQLKRLLAHPFIGDLLALYRGATLVQNADMNSVVFCEEYLRATPADVINPPPLITGDDLVASGLKPNKRFKRVLEAVRDAQLNNEITTKAEAMKLAQKLYAQFEDK